MPPQDYKDLDLFARPERLSELPRYRELHLLDAYYRGTQYDGRPDWWTGTNASGEQVPLRERRPCVIYPLPKAAVNQATRFTVGEGRFPTIKAEPVDADDALSPEMALSEEEAETLTKFVGELCRQLKLKSAALDLMRRGLSTGTTVSIVQIRNGKFCLLLANARDCHAEFADGDPDGEVLRLVWCYRYERQVELRDGSIVTKTFFFRRDITATHFVVYREAEPPELAGQDVRWEVDEEKSVEHGFGCCPVVWTRNMPDDHAALDGVSLYRDLDDEFDALNFALSQRHRGVHFFGTPQAYETDVGEDEQPAMLARTSRPPKDVENDHYARGNRERHRMGGSVARQHRPDQIWSYRGKAQLGVLETSGKAFEVATKHVADIRARILEAIDVVLLDPTTVAGKGEISAKALAILFAPLLALVDELREGWWERCFERILSMCLRVVAAKSTSMGERGERLLLPGVDRAAAILQRCWLATPAGSAWIGPRLTPSWGDYFSPSNADVKAAVDAADTAKQANLITGETASRYVAPYFGVHDPAKEAEDANAGSAHAARKKLDELSREPEEESPDSGEGDAGEEIRGAAKPEDGADNGEDVQESDG
jgi:hypothetical protein